MKTHTHNTSAVADVLRKKGFRVTAGRSTLLTLLEDAGTPLSVQDIVSRWKGKTPDVATLYRSLSDLCDAGVVRRIDLNTGIAHFEYTPSRPHHHHIVCTDCGRIEELALCTVGGLEKRLMHSSAHFRNIYSHTLEFFGRCTSCAATSRV